MPCAANPREELRKSQKDDGPQHPFTHTPIHVEVRAPFMPKIDPRGGQRAERSRHREVKQELKKIKEKLRHRHG